MGRQPHVSSSGCLGKEGRKNTALSRSGEAAKEEASPKVRAATAGCHTASGAGRPERSYPTSEVRVAAERSYPTPEVRGGGREEQPHPSSGSCTGKEAERSYSRSRSGGAL